MSKALQVEGLSVRMPVSGGILHPVRNVSFHVENSETLAVVGESGCGKSLTALAIMGLLPKRATVRARRLDFAGHSLLGLSERAMANIRGDKIAMIFQDPTTSLNPSYSIGNQLTEVMLRHRKVSRAAARERALLLLDRVGVTAAQSRLRQYPHQLSGGQRQRIMIAMALMCEPTLIVADEPTTALDVTTQAQVLRLLSALQKEFGMAVILITHDLGVVGRVSDRVAVMYAGQLVETGKVAEVFHNPLHPYTQGLLSCIPVPGRTKPGELLGVIPGTVPSLAGELTGCAFRDRCRFAREGCGAPNISERHIAPGRSYRCVLSPSALRAAETRSKANGAREHRNTRENLGQRE